MISEQLKAELQNIMAVLVNPVTLIFFTQKMRALHAEQEELLRDLTALSDRLTLEAYDFVLNGEKALYYRVDKIPAQQSLESATLAYGSTA